MTFGLSAAAAAALAVGTAAVGAGISSALGSKNQRKAANRQNALNRQAKFIDGSLTDLSAPTEVVLEDILGSNVGGVEEAIAAMDYEAQLQGQGVPTPAGMGENPMGDMSEEELMMLMEDPAFMGLGGGQQTQYAASGGAVGRPEDVYYFGVPQIMGMMQDPNPQIQGVGMQLADQMSAMPDAGMVPATANQIQTMSMGGAVTAKKYRDGTQGGFDIEVQTPQQMIESTGFGIGDEVTYMVGDSDRVSGSDMGEGLDLIRYVTKITGLAPKTFEEAKEILNQKLFLETKSRLADELMEKFDGHYSKDYDAEGMTEAEREESMVFRTDPRTYEIEDETATALSSNKNRDGLEGLSALMNPTDEEMINYFEQSRGREMDPSAQIIQGMANGGPITSDRLNQLRRR